MSCTHTRTHTHTQEKEKEREKEREREGVRGEERERERARARVPRSARARASIGHQEDRIEYAEDAEKGYSRDTSARCSQCRDSAGRRTPLRAELSTVVASSAKE